MPTYVVLYRFTEQGRKHIKETVFRSKNIREEQAQLGFEVIGHYWTQGEYDLITVVDAPSEAAMLGGLFSIAEAGNVESQTLRAFSDEEVSEALGPATSPRSYVGPGSRDW
jgi:uncharacterized protein with GYD domain